MKPDNPILLRPADIVDLSILLAFEQKLIAYEKPFAPNLQKEHFHYYDLAAYIKDPNIEVVVAEINGEIVGSGYALIRQNATYKVPANYVYLGFMYVTPNHRGKGINRKIIDYLIRWGKKRGYEEFQLTVYAENESARRAYEKAGFEPEILRMRMQVK